MLIVLLSALTRAKTVEVLLAATAWVPSYPHGYTVFGIFHRTNRCELSAYLGIRRCLLFPFPMRPFRIRAEAWWVVKRVAHGSQDSENLSWLEAYWVYRKYSQVYTASGTSL